MQQVEAGAPSAPELPWAMAHGAGRAYDEHARVGMGGSGSAAPQAPAYSKHLGESAPSRY